MSMITPAIHDLARRLIAVEAACVASEGAGGAAVRACDRLRASLEKLVGTAGFGSLLSRALAVAKVKAPALASLQVNLNGTLDGFDDLAVDDDAEAGVALLSELLGLLVTFIGETLTMQILRDAWPDAIIDGEVRRDGRQP